MKNMMLNTVNTENFANLCNKHPLGIYNVSSEDLVRFFDLPYPNKGMWCALPIGRTYAIPLNEYNGNGILLYHCNTDGVPDGIDFTFWLPQGGWYWNLSEGKLVEDYSEMDNIDFVEVLRNNKPWTYTMLREIYRRGDALSDWERGGNLNDYEEQELLDSLLVKIGAPDLATFTKY